MNNKFNKKHFPFENFEEFKNSYFNGLVRIGVDPTLAREWLLRKGKHCHTLWWITGLIFSWIPFLIMLGFLGLMIFINSLMLISFPLLIISFLLGSPHAKRTLGRVRSFFIFVILGGFLYLLVINHSDWVWLFGGMTVIFLSLEFLNKFALECFFLSVVDHEDLLKELYLNNAISFRFEN